MTGPGEQGRRPGRPRRLRRIFDLPDSEDVRREMAFHMESRVEELVSAGWEREAAEAEALRRFGDPETFAAQVRPIVRRQRRAARRAAGLESVVQDVRIGARALIRNPVFTLAALLTLALGIGANTAVFSVISGTFLKPLPYADADRLVTIWEVGERGHDMHVTEPNFRDWRAGARSFTGMAAYPSGQFASPITVLGGVEPVRARAAAVSADFFAVMGVAAAHGRLFGADDVASDAPPVVVVSHAFWQNQLGGNPDLSARPLRVGGEVYEVAGVLPAGFTFPGDTDLWAPATLEDVHSRTSHNWAVVARLRDGVTIEAAQREMTDISRRIRAEYGEEANAVDARVRSLRDELVGGYRRPLALLLAAAAIVLLVGCTNLASTQLARARSRRREFAVRASLGAGRSRLVRQLLTESLLLSLPGALVGVVIAAGTGRALDLFGPAALQDAAIGIDGGVLAFTLAVTVLAALVFGAGPALRVAHTEPAAVLRSGARGSTGGIRIWNVLITAEVALAVTLLVSAGLILRSFQRVMAIDPGFEPRGVTTVAISVPEASYPDDVDVARFYGQLLERVRAVPGVVNAGLINHLPFGGVAINGDFVIEGSGTADGYADYRVVSDDYFAALGVPVLRGRDFDALLDRRDHATAVIVNETFARRFFPAGDAVGRRIRALANDSWVYGQEDWLTIVGVAGDVRHSGPLSAPVPETYVYTGQRPYRARDAFMVVAVRDGAADIAIALRRAIRDVDPEIPVEMVPMEARFAAAFAARRFGLGVLAAFAGVALVLAGVGIFGVVAYAVERRRREMGVRLALGAAPGGVVLRTVRHAMTAVAIGIAIGITITAATTRLLRSLLYETAATDALAFAGSISLLALVGLLASWLPARRIAGIDPVRTLRAD